MDIEVQQAFLKNTHTDKYKSWAKGVNEMYRLYEHDFVSSIEEITCYHYRITCKRLTIDFFPMSGKLVVLGNNKWITVPKGSLRNILKQLMK
jgi:hypothetical protein